MKTLVALAEVVGLVPIIDSGPQPSTTPVLGDPMSSSDFPGHQTCTHTDIEYLNKKENMQ